MQVLCHEMLAFCMSLLDLGQDRERLEQLRGMPQEGGRLRVDTA